MGNKEYEIIWKDGNFFEKGKYILQPKTDNSFIGILYLVVIVILVFFLIITIPIWCVLVGIFLMVREKRYKSSVFAILAIIYFHFDIHKGWLTSFFENESEMFKYIYYANHLALGLSISFIVDAILISKYGKQNTEDKTVTLPQIGAYTLFPLLFFAIVHFTGIPTINNKPNETNQLEVTSDNDEIVSNDNAEIIEPADEVILSEQDTYENVPENNDGKFENDLFTSNTKYPSSNPSSQNNLDNNSIEKKSYNTNTRDVKIENADGSYKIIDIPGNNNKNIKEYNADGIIISETEYNYNGTLSSKINYKEGKKHGEVKTFDSNNKLSSIENYLEGKLHGEIIYYDGLKDDKGKYLGKGKYKWRVAHYKNGKLNGTNEFYYQPSKFSGCEQNNKSESTYYENGLKIGETIFYNCDGTIKK